MRRFLLAVVSAAVLAGVSIAAGAARADLPQVIARGSAGPFEVSVLAEAPIRPGMSSWIVWLPNASTEGPARVEIEHAGMRASGTAPGRVSVHVHEARARTDTEAEMQTATLTIHRAGQTGTLTFAFAVAPRPGLVDQWRALSIVPIGLLVFALHQWRVSRMRRAPAATRVR